jgi:hypothetical protein
MKKDHHYRNGQPGDWKNHFTEDLLLRYREVFGELHISLGYELD